MTVGDIPWPIDPGILSDSLSQLRLVKKALSQRIILLENAGESGSDHGYIGFTDAARGHALMLGIDQNGNALWLQNLLDTVGDLRGQGFLGLQAP